MINIEEQRNALSQNCEDMLSLCHTQIQRAFEAFTTFDTDLAEEVLLKENRINAHNLKLETETDRFIALYNPVATDLRFALALLKINYNLERIADQAFDIANYTVELETGIETEILEKLQFNLMFETLEEMFNHVITAYNDENVSQARKVFKKDKIVNKINTNAFNLVVENVVNQPALTRHNLRALLVLKKFEKVGDLLKNISESIIYHIDAKVVMHKKKKK